MRNLTGKLAVMLLMAGALAMPASAAPAALARGGGGAPHIGGRGAPHFGGGGRAAFHAAPAGRSFAPRVIGRSFTPRVGSRSFTPHVGSRSFTPHVGSRSFTRHIGNRTTNFTNVHRGARADRSVLRAQRLQRLTHRNIITNNATNRAITSHVLRNSDTLTRAQQRALHRNTITTGTITPLAARNGRFASRFASRAQSDPNWRSDPIAAHRAWRHHHRAGFVAWYGPVFWPYAYSDIFDYAFWPYGYDEGYWDYAYDDFVDSLFWGEYGPPGDYAYAYAPPSGHRAPRVSYAGVQELCKEPGTGVTAWPFTEIQRKVGLNDEQRQLLGDVRKAAADAAATFKASCPAENTFPLTPPGRLTAMTGRLQATLDAVKIVRPALDKFYNSLSDEQKERFNQLGPKRPANNPEMTAALPHNNKTCSEAKPGLATLPIEKIQDVVKPTDAQQADFKALQDATDKAVTTLQAACPDETPLTPPGRLQAMETRLQAMIDAAQTVKPALESFYASLSNEQKARFNRIGQELATSG